MEKGQELLNIGRSAVVCVQMAPEREPPVLQVGVCDRMQAAPDKEPPEGQVRAAVSVHVVSDKEPPEGQE